jgi:hypothetical protein
MLVSEKELAKECATFKIPTLQSLGVTGVAGGERANHCAKVVENLLDVVHGGDRGIGLGVLSEANETETTTAASVSVLDDDL